MKLTPEQKAIIRRMIEVVDEMKATTEYMIYLAEKQEQQTANLQ